MRWNTLKMFRADQAQWVVASFIVLYPEQKDSETAAQHYGPLLSRYADFEDERIMRRL